MSILFEWHQRGNGLEVRTGPDGAGTVVVVVDDRSSAAIVLPERAAAELATVLGEFGDDPHECVPADELGDTERERDEAHERVTALEAELRERLGEIERLKSALDLADQRVRAAETRLDEELVEHRALASAALRAGKR